ncbi:hypothetical protein E4U58_002842 [Claviceps cyperi]|nr:hypothetical protein E4U58_002842 [Claviceps cyperi]
MAEDQATKATKQYLVSMSAPKSTFGIDTTLSVAALCQPCAPAARMQEPVGRCTKQEDNISGEPVASFHEQNSPSISTDTSVPQVRGWTSVWATGLAVAKNHSPYTPPAIHKLSDRFM